MPFDRLIGRINNVPQLYHSMQLPQRQTIPWASMILPIVDQIAKSIEYQSPYNRQLRQTGLAQAKVSQANSALQLELAGPRADLERQSLATKTNFLRSAQVGGMYNGQPVIAGRDGLPIVGSMADAKTLQAVRANEAEAQFVKSYEQLAAEARKKANAEVLPQEDGTDGGWR